MWRLWVEYENDELITCVRVLSRKLFMLLDSEIFRLHYVSMWNINSLKILNSWSLRFNLCWFVEFIIFELWIVLKGYMCLWRCVVYCLVVFLFVSLCLSRLLCVCLFKICMIVTFWVCVLLRLIFQSLYAKFVKVYCLFFFKAC